MPEEILVSGTLANAVDGLSLAAMKRLQKSGLLKVETVKKKPEKKATNTTTPKPVCTCIPTTPYTVSPVSLAACAVHGPKRKKPQT